MNAKKIEHGNQEGKKNKNKKEKKSWKKKTKKKEIEGDQCAEQTSAIHELDSVRSRKIVREDRGASTINFLGVLLPWMFFDRLTKSLSLSFSFAPFYPFPDGQEFRYGLLRNYGTTINLSMIFHPLCWTPHAPPTHIPSEFFCWTFPVYVSLARTCFMRTCTHCLPLYSDIKVHWIKLWIC